MEILFASYHCDTIHLPNDENEIIKQRVEKEDQPWESQLKGEVSTRGQQAVSYPFVSTAKTEDEWRKEAVELYSSGNMSETSEDRLVMYAQMAGLVQQMVSSDKVNVKENIQIICGFACNTHTICDEEMRPLGTGFCPVISIIDHNCLPNAVLQFDESRTGVRAIDDINEGTEITISCVELATSTTSRRKALKDQYYFHCNCIHCSRLDSSAGLREDAFLEGSKCVNLNNDEPLIAEPGCAKISCDACGCERDEQEAKIVATEVEMKGLEVSKLYSSGNMYQIVENQLNT